MPGVQPDAQAALEEERAVESALETEAAPAEIDAPETAGQQAPPAGNPEIAAEAGARRGTVSTRLVRIGPFGAGKEEK